MRVEQCSRRHQRDGCPTHVRMMCGSLMNDSPAANRYHTSWRPSIRDGCCSSTRRSHHRDCGDCTMRPGWMRSWRSRCAGAHSCSSIRSVRRAHGTWRFRCNAALHVVAAGALLIGTQDLLRSRHRSIDPATAVCGPALPGAQRIATRARPRQPARETPFPHRLNFPRPVIVTDPGIGRTQCGGP